MRWGVVAVVLVVGCGKSTTNTTETTSGGPGAAPAVPVVQSLPEKLGAGAYQFDAALGSVDDAHKAVESIMSDQGGDTKEALLDLIDTFDSIGKTLAEYNVSPTPEELGKDPSVADKWQKSAIEEGNSALTEIREARGTLSDMLDSEPPAKEKAALGKADDAMAEAEDAVKEGVTQLGGTPAPEPKDDTMATGG